MAADDCEAVRRVRASVASVDRDANRRLAPSAPGSQPLRLCPFVLARGDAGDLPFCAGRGVYERVWPLPGGRALPTFALGAESLCLALIERGAETMPLLRWTLISEFGPYRSWGQDLAIFALGAGL